MSGYLRKYVGTYRVIAEYDEDTKDFPRDILGNIDDTFDDLYIPCKSNIKIKHGVGNVLSCYIPSKSKGMNILRQIYQDNIGPKLPKEPTSDDKKYLETMCSELVSTDTLVSASIMDSEVYFEFKADNIDYIASIVKPKTNGKSISPFSTKNLPKTPYKIPKSDMDKYKSSIEHLPTRIMGSKVVPDGLLINKLNKQFEQIVIEAKSTKKEKFNINNDMKLKGLKGKEYYHSIGEWDNYCKFMEEYHEN